MRGRVALALATTLSACGGAHDPVTVFFALAEAECQEELEACGTSRQTQGIVAEAFLPDPDELGHETGDRLLYADFPAPQDGLAIIEILQPRAGPAEVRYREVFRGALAFRGLVVSQDVQLIFGEGDEPLLHGTFEFTVTDPERGATRRVHSGQVLPAEPDRGLPSYPSVPNPRPPGPTGPTEPAEPTEPTETESPPDPNQPRPHRPDVSVVVVDTASGCDDPTPEPSGCDSPGTGGGGGCDSGASSGCEGDSFDGGGCDSSASSGCEADSLDAGGCDSCSAQRVPRSAQTLNAIWRLLWPVLLVGGLNRRMRRQLNASALGVSGPSPAGHPGIEVDQGPDRA